MVARVLAVVVVVVAPTFALAVMVVASVFAAVVVVVAHVLAALVAVIARLLARRVIGFAIVLAALVVAVAIVLAALMAVIALVLTAFVAVIALVLTAFVAVIALVLAPLAVMRPAIAIAALATHPAGAIHAAETSAPAGAAITIALRVRLEPLSVAGAVAAAVVPSLHPRAFDHFVGFADGDALTVHVVELAMLAIVELEHDVGDVLARGDVDRVALEFHLDVPHRATVWTFELRITVAVVPAVGMAVTVVAAFVSARVLVVAFVLAVVVVMVAPVFAAIVVVVAFILAAIVVMVTRVLAASVVVIARVLTARVMRVAIVLATFVVAVAPVLAALVAVIALALAALVAVIALVLAAFVAVIALVLATVAIVRLTVAIAARATHAPGAIHAPGAASSAHAAGAVHAADAAGASASAGASVVIAIQIGVESFSVTGAIAAAIVAGFYPDGCDDAVAATECPVVALQPIELLMLAIVVGQDHVRKVLARDDMHLRAVEMNCDGTGRATSRTVEPTVVVIALASHLPVVTLVVTGPVAAVVVIAFAVAARHDREAVACRGVTCRGAAEERAEKKNQTELESRHARDVRAGIDSLQEDLR